MPPHLGPASFPAGRNREQAAVEKGRLTWCTLTVKVASAFWRGEVVGSSQKCVCNSNLPGPPHPSPLILQRSKKRTTTTFMRWSGLCTDREACMHVRVTTSGTKQASYY